MKKICPYCDKEYLPTRKNQVYCSYLCRYNAYNSGFRVRNGKIYRYNEINNKYNEK